MNDDNKNDEFISSSRILEKEIDDLVALGIDPSTEILGKIYGPNYVPKLDIKKEHLEKAIERKANERVSS